MLKKNLFEILLRLKVQQNAIIVFVSKVRRLGVRDCITHDFINFVV